MNLVIALNPIIRAQKDTRLYVHLLNIQKIKKAKLMVKIAGKISPKTGIYLLAKGEI